MIQAERSQQKVSNPLTRDAIRAPDAEIHEHATALVDTGHHALRAFGTKRLWVRISTPTSAQMRRREKCIAVLPDDCVGVRVTRVRQDIWVQLPHPAWPAQRR